MGLHLDSQDAVDKQALLARLTEAFCDERLAQAGQLALDQDGRTQLESDWVFDRAWRAGIDKRFGGHS
jgi:hypothetical protein